VTGPDGAATPTKRRSIVGRIVVTEFVSLDGVMEDPGGSETFKYGGWSFEFARGEEGDKFKVDETMNSEALLLGRVTYEGFASAWPSRTGAFADMFNTMPKYVVSSTLDEPLEWNNSKLLKGVSSTLSRSSGTSSTERSSSTAVPGWCRRCSRVTWSTSCG
jgi:dihydrofolate reductase